MKPGAFALAISVSAVLLAGAGTLYFLAQDGSGRHYRESIDLVRRMQVLSSDWSVEITRVRSDPFSDFDPLVAFLPRMARLEERLSGHVRRIPRLPDRIAGEVKAFQSMIEAKEERIERFKSGHAVLRNSRRYLPLAAESVSRRARALRIAMLEGSVSSLMRDANRHLETPSQTSEIRLVSAIEGLRKASVGYPLSLAHALENLLAHAQVLVDKQGPTQEVFERATSSDISEAADRLAGNLEFELGREAVRASDYDRGFLAVLGALVAFWIGFALYQKFRGGQAAPRPLPVEGWPPVTVPAPVARDTLAAAEPPDPGPPLQNGFVVKCVAGTLAASAGEVADRMAFLRKTHRRLRDTLRNGASPADPSVAAVLDEQVDAISAVAASVGHRMNGIADLAKRLDTFSDAPAARVDRRMIDVNACIEDVVAAASPGTGTTIVKNLGDLPDMFASGAELRLLLGQLVENALLAVRDLAGKNGIVKIDSARNDDAILITIVDNGVGIAPDRRRSIFKPFYTSREGAMGIGLPLAGHLVRKYRGSIKINSLPGQGTVARIVLPAGMPRP